MTCARQRHQFERQLVVRLLIFLQLHTSFQWQKNPTGAGTLADYGESLYAGHYRIAQLHSSYQLWLSTKNLHKIKPISITS